MSNNKRSLLLSLTDWVTNTWNNVWDKNWPFICFDWLHEWKLLNLVANLLSEATKCWHSLNQLSNTAICWLLCIRACHTLADNVYLRLDTNKILRATCQILSNTICYSILCFCICLTCWMLSDAGCNCMSVELLAKTDTAKYWPLLFWMPALRHCPILRATAKTLENTKEPKQ